jgi:hypothetical protein
MDLPTTVEETASGPPAADVDVDRAWETSSPNGALQWGQVLVGDLPMRFREDWRSLQNPDRSWANVHLQSRGRRRSDLWTGGGRTPSTRLTALLWMVAWTVRVWMVLMAALWSSSCKTPLVESSKMESSKMESSKLESSKMEL